YGDNIFPLQVAFLLSAPERDFTGGEFLLTEQRPRMQSRGEVVPLRQGEGVIFSVHHRPVRGTRGTYRVNMRPGVSRLRSSRRHTCHFPRCRVTTGSSPALQPPFFYLCSLRRRRLFEQKTYIAGEDALAVTAERAQFANEIADRFALPDLLRIVGR